MQRLLFALLLTPLLAASAGGVQPAPSTPAAAATAVGRADSAPLRRADVAADATFVFHLDLAALRSGPAGDILDHDELAAGFDDPEDRAAWLKARPLIEETLSVTLYGSSFGGDRSVLLVRTLAGADDFFAAVAAQGHAPELREEAGRTLRVWHGGDGDVFAYADPRPGPGQPRVVIASQSRADFDAALALLEGRGEGLEAADGPLAALCRPRAGAVVFAAITDLDPIRKHEHAAAVLKNAEQVRLEIGEHAGSAFADIAVTTQTPETARQMADVCRGLIAMGQMFLAHEPEHAAEARELLSGLSVSTEDRTTTIALSCPTAKVVSALKSACADRPMSTKPEAGRAHHAAPHAAPEKPTR